MIAPSLILAATLPGAPVVWFTLMIVPRTASSPPVIVVCGNGQLSVAVGSVVVAPPASAVNPAAKLAIDAGVLSRRLSSASFSMVGSAFPHFWMPWAVAAQVLGEVSLESAQLEYGGVTLP
jgi:hypothetical protein